MTNRERILALLRGEVPDQVPWFGDLDYWYNALVYKQQLPEKYAGDGYFQLNRDLGVGFYLQGYEPFTAVYEGVEVLVKEEKEERITEIHTPFGSLTEVQRFLPTSCSWAYTKHLVETADDLPAFRYWLEHTRYEPNYAEAERRAKIIGDNGVTLCYLPRSPFMLMVALYSGIQNLVYLDLDAPEEFAATMELLEAKADGAAQIALESPAECLMIPENLSSEVVGLRYYAKYMQPYERKWVKLIQDAGKFSFIHMDGTLRGLIRPVAETGFRVLEALTPAPVGDLEIEELAAAAGPGPILWGGLPGVYFTDKVTDGEFDAFVQRVLGVMRQDPRFVLGVADQVPPDGIWERVARVRELVELYGNY